MDEALVSSLFGLLYPNAEYTGGEEERRDLANRLHEVAGLLTGERGTRVASGGGTTMTTRSSPSRSEVKPRYKKPKQEGGPDFSKCLYEHVALKIAYFGSKYYGFARLRDIAETVEGKFFMALRKCRLIPPDADPLELGYSRCGRTDRGVSAAGQVVALRLRRGPDSQPLDYVALVNRWLPDDIRVLGFRVVDPSFSARFDATGRHYKYFFLQDGSYDIGRMNLAAANFVGEHDYRNFCKMDDSVKTFCRTVKSCEIEPAGGDDGAFVLNVMGSAFLWHQVRCMAAVLFSVGKGKLQEHDVERYLNITEQPERPSYTMASEDPLLLYECFFDPMKPFAISPHAHRKLKDHLKLLLSNLQIRMQLIQEVLSVVDRTSSELG